MTPYTTQEGLGRILDAYFLKQEITGTTFLNKGFLHGFLEYTRVPTFELEQSLLKELALTPEEEHHLEQLTKEAI